MGRNLDTYQITHPGLPFPLPQMYNKVYLSCHLSTLRLVCFQASGFWLRKSYDFVGGCGLVDICPKHQCTTSSLTHVVPLGSITTGLRSVQRAHSDIKFLVLGGKGTYVLAESLGQSGCSSLVKLNLVSKSFSYCCIAHDI